MKILVVYDSFFGNTEKVAQSITQTLKQGHTVEVKRVSQVEKSDLQNLDLIILGSPTRGFRPSEATQTFLKEISASELAGVKAAVFDTRIDVATIKSGLLRSIVRMGGYAEKAMGSMLAKKGATLVGSTEGFIVLDREGPLKDGELERAAVWAKGLLSAM